MLRPGALNAASVRPGRARRGGEGAPARGAHWPRRRRWGGWGPGQAGGSTWPERVRRRRGREHGPGPAELGDPAGTPRRLSKRPGGAARGRACTPRPRRTGTRYVLGAQHPSPDCALPQSTPWGPGPRCPRPELGLRAPDSRPEW